MCFKYRNHCEKIICRFNFLTALLRFSEIFSHIFEQFGAPCNAQKGRNDQVKCPGLTSHLSSRSNSFLTLTSVACHFILPPFSKRLPWQGETKGLVYQAFFLALYLFLSPISRQKVVMIYKSPDLKNRPVLLNYLTFLDASDSINTGATRQDSIKQNMTE